ncbi:MAG: hypothetical protein L3J28_10950 [Candidatus Polarisedimenticolaceae bacterium]|nr:hypothetical protein [Candidatus Polarisedimenticolaceae bacterium]
MILLRFITLVCLLAPLAGVADSLEMLLMPGPVIAGHQKYEEACHRCHKPFAKRTQTALCNECHEAIKADIDRETGFHGKRLASATFRCRDCHTEHLGREADIVKLNSANFDHDKTDYPLIGLHRGRACGGCHETGKKHRDAETGCFDCHQKDDPHKTALGEKCDECHSEKGWLEYRFDHDKTAFKLKNRHTETACDSCHPDARYKPTPTRCYACHRFEDVHAGRNGEKCQDCHDERDWKKNRFSHKKDVDDALQGVHKRLPCSACHQGEFKQKKSEEERRTRCVSCHRQDDQHLGRYGEKCKTCHQQKKWSTLLFKHDDDTKFPLVARHKSTHCDSCHAGDLYEDKLEMSCISCHLADDRHDTPSDRSCGYCHNAQGWLDDIRFDHGFSTFPLIGLHGMVSCESCHLSGRFLEIKRACVDCHLQDDQHEKRLGEDCANCHNPNGWRLWQFDHDQQADYSLTGQHENLACKNCHIEVEVVARSEPRICRDCHLNEDSHNSLFGSRCGRCHSTENWLEVSLPKER